MIRPNWIADTTALSCFRENPELFRLRHVLGLKPAYREEAPEAGKAFHAAARHWFSQETTDVEGSLKALAVAWGPVPDPLMGVTEKRPLSLFERIFKAYAERWPREDDPFEVVRNEEYVEGVIDLPWNQRYVYTGFEYCGIIDRVIRENGRNYVKDTKTTSAAFTADYFEMYEVSGQMIGYCALELVNGHECFGYYIDGVHVNEHYISKKTGNLCGGNINPEKDFVRDVEWTLKQIEMLMTERGPNEPWPVYENFKFGKKGAYWDFLTEPAEAHAGIAEEYKIEFWEPKEVAGG
jgi:hypothetical protein